MHNRLPLTLADVSNAKKEAEKAYNKSLTLNHEQAHVPLAQAYRMLSSLVTSFDDIELQRCYMNVITRQAILFASRAEGTSKYMGGVVHSANDLKKALDKNNLTFDYKSQFIIGWLNHQVSFCKSVYASINSLTNLMSAREVLVLLHLFMDQVEKIIADHPTDERFMFYQMSCLRHLVNGYQKRANEFFLSNSTEGLAESVTYYRQALEYSRKIGQLQQNVIDKMQRCHCSQSLSISILKLALLRPIMNERDYQDCWDETGKAITENANIQYEFNDDHTMLSQQLIAIESHLIAFTGYLLSLAEIFCCSANKLSQGISLFQSALTAIDQVPSPLLESMQLKQQKLFIQKKFNNVSITTCLQMERDGLANKINLDLLVTTYAASVMYGVDDAAKSVALQNLILTTRTFQLSCLSKEFFDLKNMLAQKFFATPQQPFGYLESIYQSYINQCLENSTITLKILSGYICHFQDIYPAYQHNETLNRIKYIIQNIIKINDLPASWLTPQAQNYNFPR